MKSSFFSFANKIVAFSYAIFLLSLLQDLVLTRMSPELAISINEFAFDLYQQACAQSADDVFLSPFSISTVMSMIYLGSNGETFKQMSRTLRMENMSKTIHEQFDEYIKLINIENANFTLTTANGLYPSTGMEILDDYVTMCFKHYKTNVVPADYAEKASDVEKEINSWVEKETKGKIKNLIPSGSLNSLTVLVLVNAIYFKGDWAKKFKPENTVIQPFYKVSGNAVKVFMMKSRMERTWYGEHHDLDCKALQLPYKGEDLYMLILLPNKMDGLSALESNLTVEALKVIQKSMSAGLVEVSLPKFKIEARFELSKALSKLGMPDAFDETKADLSGIRKQKRLYLSKVFHKAFVEVNEEGTEAAAATGAVIRKRSLPVVHSFDANHSFLFLIIDKRTEVILFLGRLAEPRAVEVQQGKDEL